jgi:hypothetical protein
MAHDTMKQLSILCAQMRDAEQAVELAEKVFKVAKAKLFSIATEDIPALMTEIGVKEITLETGEKVTVALDIASSITEANKENAFKWLIDNGYGSIIKTEVMVAFGKDELPKALALAEELTEKGLVPEMSRGVHASTLKAWLKERVLAEQEVKEEIDPDEPPIVPVPMELFGAMPFSIAKLKAPKGSTQ